MGETKVFATVRDVRQIGPDSWEERTRVLHMSYDTTVEEIADWAESCLRTPANRDLDAVVSITFEPAR